MKSSAKLFLAILIIIPAIGLSFVPAFVSPVHAGLNPTDAGFSIVPDCDAWIFPKDGGRACGFSKFEELIVNIIKWLLYIIVPIAVCLIGWAGFKIMTSAGDSEAIHQAYGIIKIVVIGVLIAALSYIIIVNVFNALNVQNVNYNFVT
jgi:Type IV secretion system pilin